MAQTSKNTRKGTNMRNGFLRSIKSMVSVLAALSLYSCNRGDDGPVFVTDSEPVPANIFPLVATHQFTYSGYLLDSNGAKISASESVFSSTWTIQNEVRIADYFPASAISKVGRANAVLIEDNTTAAGYIANPQTIPVFVYYDSSSGDYYYMTNFGYVFRTDSILDAQNSFKPREDSLRFIKLASPKVGTTVKIVAFKEDFVSYLYGRTTPLNITVTIFTNFEKKENVALNLNGKDTTLTTYYLVVSTQVSAGALVQPETINAKFWLAEGIGPVQIYLAGDKETFGSFRKLKSKNF